MDGDSTIIPVWVLAIVFAAAFFLWGRFLDWRDDRKKRNARKGD